MEKTAVVFGATGQVGSYLCESLLEKGYNVVGIKRRSSTNNCWRLKNILTFPYFNLAEGDITDAVSIYNVIGEHKPNEIYACAAQSHVHTSFEQPQYTAMVDYIGQINILEAMRKFDIQSKLMFCATSEMFGSSMGNLYTRGTEEDPNLAFYYQNEKTELCPQSPYAISKVAAFQTNKLYRTAYNMFICSAIMFNNESPRRGEEFVTRKITKWIGDNYSKIKLGYQPLVNADKLNLGNLDASRDWGSSKDYVEALQLMLQQESPDDYVIATGETHTIKELLDVAFGYINITDWTPYVYVNPKFIRPAEVPYLRGDMSKAREKLGWSPTTTFKELIEEMVESDIRKENR
jgi:GDPmannose 4,6-dehydratase